MLIKTPNYILMFKYLWEKSSVLVKNINQEQISECMRSKPGHWLGKVPLPSVMHTFYLLSPHFFMFYYYNNNLPQQNNNHQLYTFKRLRKNDEKNYHLQLWVLRDESIIACFSFMQNNTEG